MTQQKKRPFSAKKKTITKIHDQVTYPSLSFWTIEVTLIVLIVRVSELKALVVIMTKKTNESDALFQTQRCIKDRLQNDKINFFGHVEQRQSIYDLLERSATFAESNIALLIGVRGSGKTAVSTLRNMSRRTSLRLRNLFFLPANSIGTAFDYQQSKTNRHCHCSTARISRYQRYHCIEINHKTATTRRRNGHKNIWFICRASSISSNMFEVWPWEAIQKCNFHIGGFPFVLRPHQPKSVVQSLRFSSIKSVAHLCHRFNESTGRCRTSGKACEIEIFASSNFFESKRHFVCGTTRYHPKVVIIAHATGERSLNSTVGVIWWRFKFIWIFRRWNQLHQRKSLWKTTKWHGWDDCSIREITNFLRIGLIHGTVTLMN